MEISKLPEVAIQVLPAGALVGYDGRVRKSPYP